MTTRLDKKFNKKRLRVLMSDDVKKYYENWIAISSSINREVVAFDKNFTKVDREAEKKGYKDPLIFYVLNPEVSEIYHTSN